jgi:prepilin-type N-terminal cleavage/methylation domain-containing protein
LRRIGFTLAEVLITLSIIGVVAALTIPSIINNSTDQQNLVKLKKEYSVLSQATAMLVSTDGSIDTSSVNALSTQYLKVMKLSPVNTGNTDYYNYKQTSINTFPSFGYVLSDGSIWRFLTALPTDSSCTQAKHNGSMRCGYVYMDVNGNTKGPNMIGKDFFVFSIVNENGAWKVYPWGIDQDTNANHRCSTSNCTNNSNCNMACTWNAVQAHSPNDMPN